MNFKKMIAGGAAAATLLCGSFSFAGTADLIFSETMEGNGVNQKYLEIYNNGAGTSSLTGDDVGFRRYTNASTTPTATLAFTTLFPGGRGLASGDYFVLANNSVDHLAAGLAAADAYNTFVNHNGDDKYDLVSAISTTPVLIDGYAGDLAAAGTTTPSFGINLCTHRVASALPNNGNWGAAATPGADGSLSGSGNWIYYTITAGNANASAVGTPNAGGGGGGAAVPVEMSEFSVE